MEPHTGAEGRGPLAGTRVLDLSTIVSGPLCTQILGDLGADVVKVESKAGDTARHLGGVRKADMTGFFVQWNRNKRSIVLDLKTEPAQAALRRLAARVDVLVENFRPEVMARLGLAWDALAAENPRLVYVSINGFGSEGPDAGQPAYDMVIQARTGFARLLGNDAGPKLISNLVADKTSGLTAAWAALAALLAREKTGRGQRVEVPMLDAFASFVLPDVLGARAFGDPPAVAALGANLYRAWETADGHVVVVVIEDRQFEAVCRAIGREELAGDARYATPPTRTRAVRDAGDGAAPLEDARAGRARAPARRPARRGERPRRVPRGCAGAREPDRDRGGATRDGAGAGAAERSALLRHAERRAAPAAHAR
jgi:crotonobetainyl-CoA:carnitine CoA-transferase CaiB-like acyl-CoA transferase